MTEKLLSPQSTAQRLRLTRSGVVYLTLTGKLPEQRDSSRRRFFLETDVERVARERERSAESFGAATAT